MLEQWKANRLLAVPKIYIVTGMIDLAPGADYDYQLESNDGYEVFIFDVRVPRRNVNKTRFQLRYQRSVVLARLCHSAPRTNPDGEFIELSHHIFTLTGKGSMTSTPNRSKVSIA